MAGCHTNASRSRILDTTESLFIALGYKRTSMRQIAGEAKVSLAAMNYHLGSKEGLMREVIRRRLNLPQQRVPASAGRTGNRSGG